MFVVRSPCLHVVLSKLSKQTETPIILKASLPEVRIPVTVSLQGTPLREAVMVLADMVGLGVVRRATFYYVTSAKDADRLRREIK